TMIWTIVLPIILAIISYYPNGSSSYTEIEKQYLIVSFWAFIVAITFINGIGMQISRIREDGLLKTFVMITGQKFPFILAIILSQCLLSLISILVFNLTVGSLLHVLTTKLIFTTLIFIVLCVPISFFFLVLAFIPVKVDTLTTIVNILTIFLFYINSRTDNQFYGLEWLNPLYLFNEISRNLLSYDNFISFVHLITPLFFYVLYIVIGLLCMKYININSKTMR
ncbi:hypothetical protein, partial [Staphylococcus lutrae]